MQKLRGVGDLIALFTKWLGIQWLIEKAGIPCKCPLRQEKMNVKLPF